VAAASNNHKGNHLLTTGGVAARLSTNKKTAQAFLRASQKQGAFQLNGRWRISIQDFEQILTDLKCEPYSILLVDDDPAGVRLFAEAIEHCKVPIRLLVAVDGAAALLCIKAKAPDLVILDVTLPDVDALHFLREIQPLHIATLVYSGNIAPIRQALELGAVDCILKEAKADKHLHSVQELIRESLRKDAR
jgi:CheY-like chemotaxis protein